MVHKIALASLISVLATLFLMTSVPGFASGSFGISSAYAQTEPVGTAADQSTDSEMVNSDQTTLRRQQQPPPNLTGRWSGPMHDTEGGDGQLTLTITQPQDSAGLHGDWSSTIARIGGGGNLGDGDIAKDDFVHLKLNGGNCHTIVHGTLINSHIIAVYKAKRCGGPRSSGHFDLTKQEGGAP